MMSAVSVFEQLIVIQISFIQPKFHNLFIYLFSKHAIKSDKSKWIKKKQGFSYKQKEEIPVWLLLLKYTKLKYYTTVQTNNVTQAIW